MIIVPYKVIPAIETFMDFLFFATVVSTWLSARADFIPLEIIKELTRQRSPFTKSADDKGCSDTIITERKGIITSPHYPDLYSDHISCSWHIKGNFGEVVTISFYDLDIEESGTCEESHCCIFNWIKIGPSLNGTEKPYCGQNGIYRPTFVSETNKLWIKFHISSVIAGGRGFRLFFWIGPRQVVTCQNGYFRCDNRDCVPENARCNGLNECRDGSDEKGCTELCPSGKLCRTMFHCYDAKKHCDGIIDCPDFSDEMDCGYCSTNQTRCGPQSTQCYSPLTQRCNRIIDCVNGEDEMDCLDGCPGKIMCGSGTGCYPLEERCNGIAQCGDSSDEKNCGADLCNYEHGGFLCGNGHCIREVWKCDRTNDCGDGTDEYNCLRNSVLTAAVMGSLICALLLIIAISCTCRLYALRALENHMSSHETPLSRLSQEFFFREPPPSYAVAVGDHHRNLCVENVHYNVCARRGRRRPRRARRHNETHRAPVSVLGGLINQNFLMSGANGPLSISSSSLPASVLSESTLNPSSPQSSRSEFSSAMAVSLNNAEAGCQNREQGARNKREQHLLKNNILESNNQINDAELIKIPNLGTEISTNVESSCSKNSTYTQPTVHDSRRFNQIELLPEGEGSEVNTNHSFHVQVLGLASGSHTSESSLSDDTGNDIVSPDIGFGANCDSNDMQPLIT